MKRHRQSSSSSAYSYVTADSYVEDLPVPASLKREVSPPPVRNRSNKSATAKVEAGEATVDDHVAFFASKLLAARLPEGPSQPRLSHEAWLDLYHRNLHDGGHHFVIHQHDHPIAGTHYDLRLQVNPTSSVSFAIMYGLPGDPNSRRLNRNATETRVHNLWNHLIETASAETGSMLIWDTGEYEVLPYERKGKGAIGADSDSSSDFDRPVNQSIKGPTPQSPPQLRFTSHLSQPHELAQSFASRKIRLRLHGIRLPPGYTISLRLTKDNYRSDQPVAPSFRRLREGNKSKSQRPAKLKRRHRESTVSESDIDAVTSSISARRTVSSLTAIASPPSSPPLAASQESDVAIRANNAYIGATNSIGSVHQRKWFLSLDRAGCGFKQTRKPPKGHHAQTYWVRPDYSSSSGKSCHGFERFHVLGRSHERSIVTGRLASEILSDEGVEGYVPRGRWRAVVE